MTFPRRASSSMDIIPTLRTRRLSTAGVKDHANTLLNLLDMGEVRSWYLSSLFSSNVRLPKIIFIGHSLGGLVIKQVCVMQFQCISSNVNLGPAQRPKKTLSIPPSELEPPASSSSAVRIHGTKGVELGKIAAKVADCLEHNSLFTRQMSVRFSHQLEDYKDIQLHRGKEVLLGGSGPASISHLVVDEESAVLGLPGQRETRLKLDADHRRCARSQIQSSLPSRDTSRNRRRRRVYLPCASPDASQQQRILPSQSIASTDCPTVIGTLFVAVDNDPRSMQAAEQRIIGSGIKLEI
ncbi:uncharacterized protein ATNIH1004_001951 [Aspergillus tanneri]|uniref:DUF676 domain-containing protein n=1 Tax=Aspergillus tanneri TaxID=1220188 RepID=A0A5M9M7C0_9EURO|nr:uncharacterized protein ATNIH1004_001951 [Aspergillus tanneri]KAA8641486.1 hypothetical protein ATNIH1004_001951 [Aspergillus tanneri]